MVSIPRRVSIPCVLHKTPVQPFFLHRRKFVNVVAVENTAITDVIINIRIICKVRNDVCH